MNKVLAIDMGATSIRAIIGYIDNGKLITDEVMRFNHEIKEINGRKQWDFDKILKKIEDTILKYKNEIVSIGVDTWGVDFGLLNSQGELLYNPTSYRDDSNEIGFKSIGDKIDFTKLFSRTGNQIMNINTLFQLETLKINDMDLYNQADCLLMMPDLINYYLCGEKFGEKTICSTTQMFDLNRGDWNYNLIDELNLNYRIFPRIINNKIKIGSTKNSQINSLRDLNIDVISVASHDTASAVYVTDSYIDRDCLFLSSGTWSLIGCCNEKPVYDIDAYRYSLTNETGYDNKNMFFKNVTGLYLIEKLRSDLKKDNGEKYSYDEITQLVLNSNVKENILIDVDYEIFTKESEDFVNDLDEYLKNTKQNKVVDKNDYFKIIYLSIVDNYKKVVHYIEKTLGRKFTKIHVIGGGSQSAVLCQMIANALNIEVYAGPKEATAIGNILAQMEYLNKVDNIRERFTDSYEIRKYYPKNKILERK